MSDNSGISIQTVINPTPTPHPNNLLEMMERVFDLCDLKEVSKRTYRYGIRDFVTWNPEGKLGPSTLLEYKTYLRGRTDFSPSTKNQYLTGVRTVLRKLHEMGYLDRDYGKGVKGFEVNRRLKKSPITDDEVTKVFTYLQGVKDRRLILIYNLLYFQGLRQHEVVTLRVEDFDRDTKTLWILGKGKDDREQIDLHPETVRIIDWYLNETGLKSGYLFYSRKRKSGHITGRHLSLMIQRVHETCGITNTGHGWRKVFVSKLIESGMDLLTVRSFSRHKSLDMLTVYYDRLDRKKKLPKYYEVFTPPVSMT
jgi:integrase/recombinase XerC